jgi:hypothetical protein
MNTKLHNKQAEKRIPAFISMGAAGVIVASLVNAALFAATSSFAFPPDAIIAGAGVPVNLAAVIVSTVVGGVLAVGGYALLRRFLPSFNRPGRLYALAALALLLLAYFPFTIQNIGGAQIIMMQLMHVVAGIIPLYAMIRSER